MLKKLVKSISLLIPESISIGTLGMNFGEWDKKIDKWFDLWSNQNMKLISSQLLELNESIKNSGKKIIIFIDEIDRLETNEIIKFLIFARIFDIFECVWIVISFDYEQVLNKLMGERSISRGKYEIVVNYLEKFFQARYEISISTISLSNYIMRCLRDYEIINLDDFSNEVKKELDENIGEIVKILETPRNIKKWLIELLRIQALLKFMPNEKTFFSWLCFTAIFVKHPIILSNFSKITRNIFFVEESIYQKRSKTIYEKIPFKGTDKKEVAFLASMGLIKKSCETEVKEFIKTTWEFVQ